MPAPDAGFAPRAVAALDALFRPRSIALVGVSGGTFDPAARNSMARRFLENLLRHGFDGRIYPVNPRYQDIAGLPAYPTVTAIPGEVDAALLIVPRQRVAAAVADCAAKGVKGVVVISSGFAEAGAQGKADELALVAMARAHGMRLLGPNCFGWYNSHTRTNLFGSASLLNRPLVAGAIGFVTQSGALAAAILDRAQERGIGFSQLITTGNQADVDNVESLEYLIDDPSTRVLALFAEAIADAPRLRAAVQRAARAGKPCVVLKTGASEVGRRTALAHTGSLVGDDAVYDAAFRQDGVVRVHDPDELFLTAALLSHAVPRGSRAGVAAAPGDARLAVISMSGAMGGIVADGAARHGVRMADLSASTREALAAVEGVSGSLNPLDAAMATWSGDFGIVGQLAGMLAVDPGVDVVMLAISGLPYAERLIDDCAASVRAAGKVFVPMWAADHADLLRAMPRLIADGVVVFETCESALQAIGALARFQRHQARAGTRALDQGEALPAPPPNPGRVAAARALMAASGTSSTLTEFHSKQLLALYGVPIAAQEIATCADDAVAAAARVGYPVALKIHSAAVPHKTEAGALALGLADAAAVRGAFDTVTANAAAYLCAQANGRDRSDALQGVLVTPMAAAGVEAVVGAYHDGQFGPVLLAGLGGIWVEVMRDTALRLAPVSAAEASDMFDDLRGAALFKGVRGRPPADQAAAAQVVSAVSAMMQELPEWIAEVDINPLIVHAQGKGATVADALVVTRAPHMKPDSTRDAKPE